MLELMIKNREREEKERDRDGGRETERGGEAFNFTTTVNADFCCVCMNVQMTLMMSFSAHSMLELKRLVKIIIINVD